MKKTLLSPHKLSENGASILLAAVIIARATSLLFAKYCLDVMQPFTLLAVRSITALLFLIPLFRNNLRNITRYEILGGSFIGLFMFLMMAAELVSLQRTESSIISIIENTAIVFVPIVQAIISRRFPHKNALICCSITMVGIFLLLYEGGQFRISYGETMSLLAALSYTFAIISTAKISRKGDAINIGIIQVAVMAVFALAISLFVEGFTLPSTANTWFYLLYLALVCTGFGFTLQPLAQSRCSSEKAGLFCALSPLTSVLLGVIVLGEAFFLRDVVGFVLILGSVIVYTLFENRTLSKHS